MLEPKDIRTAREKLGWTIFYLAKKAGVEWATIVNAEENRKKPHQSTMKAICAALEEGELEKKKLDNPEGI